MKRLTLTLTFALAACSGSDTSDVRLDLAALHQHAAQTEQTFDSVELLVSGPGLTMAPVALDPDVLTFDIEVPSGPARTFAVEAWNDGVDERMTVYWGAVAQDLLPGTTVDLILPVGPAGRLSGTVELLGAVAFPATAELTFTAMEPMPPLPETIVLPVVNGAFSAPMPMGMWNVTGTVSVDGATYSLPEGEHVFVMQGEPSFYALVMILPVVLTDATVRVRDVAAAALAGITVLVNDATGALKLETTTSDGTSGNFGEAVVPVDNGDMISVLDDTDPMSYEVLLYTVAGVSRGDVLDFVVGHDTGGGGTLLGSTLIDAGMPPGTPTNITVIAGACSAWPAIGAPGNMSVYDYCLNASGELDMLAVAGDFNGNASAIGVELGINPMATSHTITTWTDTSPTFEVSLSDFPASPPLDYFAQLTLRRGALNYYTGQYGYIASSDPVPHTFLVPSGFADWVDVSVSASDAVTPGEQRYGRRFAGATLPSTFPLAVSSSFLPPITSLTMDTLTNPSRPSLVWTTAAAPATYDVVIVEIAWFEKTSLIWRQLGPPSAVTTAQFPELPASLSAYDPATLIATPRESVELHEVSNVAGYDGFLSTAGASYLNSSVGIDAQEAVHTFAASTWSDPQ